MGLGSRLEELREYKGLERADISDSIHQKFPGRRKKSTIRGDVVQIETDQGGLADGLRGKEPYRTILLLYVDALHLAEEEREEVAHLIKQRAPHFDLYTAKPSAEFLGRMTMADVHNYLAQQKRTG